MQGQVYAAVVFKRDALAAEQILHDMRPAEVTTAGQCSEAVHDAMTWKTCSCSSVQRPPDGSGGALQSDELRNVSVRGDLPGRDFGHHVENTIEERLVSGFRAQLPPRMTGSPLSPPPTITVFVFGDSASCCVASMPLNRKKLGERLCVMIR